MLGYKVPKDELDTLGDKFQARSPRRLKLQCGKYL
jgi:hypothetical protein